jgi:dTDP-4-dehydrorhamnose 3,5-epimerase-like enzyme
MLEITLPHMVQVPVRHTELGALGVVEKNDPFPHPIKRVYFLYDIPSKAVRGSHAHKELAQLIVAISGSFIVNLDNGVSTQSFYLTSPAEGLYIPPGHWRTLTDFSSGAAAMVFASEEYSESDYIRDYTEFLEWKNV